MFDATKGGAMNETFLKLNDKLLEAGQRFSVSGSKMIKAIETMNIKIQTQLAIKQAARAYCWQNGKNPDDVISSYLEEGGEKEYRWHEPAGCVKAAIEAYDGQNVMTAVFAFMRAKGEDPEEIVWHQGDKPVIAYELELEAVKVAVDTYKQYQPESGAD